MRLDLRALLAPALAVAILVVLLSQTMAAIRQSGTWARRSKTSRTPVVSPYGRLDRMLDPGTGGTAVALRDPFAYGRAAAPRVEPRPTGAPAPPRVIARPTLTAIVFDADPRASIRWNGRDYSVRQDGMFDEFQVKRITRDEVTLSRGGETIVLSLVRKGD